MVVRGGIAHFLTKPDRHAPQQTLLDGLPVCRGEAVRQIRLHIFSYVKYIFLQDFGFEVFKPMFPYRIFARISPPKFAFFILISDPMFSAPGTGFPFFLSIFFVSAMVSPQCCSRKKKNSAAKNRTRILQNYFRLSKDPVFFWRNYLHRQNNHSYFVPRNYFSMFPFICLTLPPNFVPYKFGHSNFRSPR